MMTSSYQARVLYDFPGEVAGDLSVTAGEEITVLPHLEVGEGWLHAINKEGEQGGLPASYTEHLDLEDHFTEEEEEERFRRESVRPKTWDDDIDDDDERNEDSSQVPETPCLAPGPSIIIFFFQNLTNISSL